MEAKSSKSIQNKEKSLQIMSPSTSSSPPVPFQLPHDWVVEKRSRSTSDRVDTYYFEPGTGRQFRSLTSIQKYLSGETNAARAAKRAKVGNEKDMRIVPFMFNTSEFNLPDGWLVQEIPRKNINYEGKIDKICSVQSQTRLEKYRCMHGDEFAFPLFLLFLALFGQFYIEPGTGKRFRSLLSVARYLEPEEGKEHPPTPKLKSVYQLYPSTHYGSRKKQISDVKVKAFALNLSTPPAKVKWVLNGPWGNTWNAFMGDSLVPASMKQRWSEALSTTLNDRF